MLNRTVQIKKSLSSILGEAATCSQQNQIYKAVSLYKSALKLAPKIPQLHNNLGSLMRELGMVEESIECFEKAISLKPDYASAHSNLLFLLQNLPDQNLKTLLIAHQLWSKQQLEKNQNQTKESFNYQIRSPIVIGLVSQDLYFHPVSVFMLPWLEKHDRINFKIIAYSDREQADEMTKRIRQSVDEWRNVAGKDDDELALQIEEDRVNVLIDLAGHTAGNRLKMFARRVAPLQISWIGYSATTGIPNMDLAFMDDYVAPEGCDEYFTEKLVRLEGLRFCYTPPFYAPEVAPSPFLKSGYLTFGCFNNLAKLTPLVIESWASILNALPQSRLILKWKSLGDQEAVRGIQLKFENFGVAPGRIECRGWSKHTAMLAEYSDVDVALDPFPFSGGLTSCDALYMGVPVITMPGELPISRQTGSFLNAIGLNEFIAKNPTEYLNVAINLSRNSSQLPSLREMLRERLLQSVLCDSKGFAKAVEKAIQKNLLEITMSKV